MKVRYRSVALEGEGRVDVLGRELRVHADGSPPAGAAVEVLLLDAHGQPQARILGVVRQAYASGFRVREVSSRRRRQRLRDELAQDRPGLRDEPPPGAARPGPGGLPPG